jgi:hypothetical protein
VELQLKKPPSLGATSLISRVYHKLDAFLDVNNSFVLYHLQMSALTPLPGRVLVEIKEKYAVAQQDQKYDTKTSGVCIGVLFDNHAQEWNMADVDECYLKLKGKLVFWQEYKEGSIIERDGKKYAFIKIEDLDGYENVEAN